MATASVICEHCGEKLLVSSGSRLVLANPIRAYLPAEDSTQAEHPHLRFSTGKRPPVSAERKKRTMRLARERIAQQKQLCQSGLLYGILAIVFGGTLGTLGWLRLEALPGDWTGWLGLGIGAPVLAIGFFVTVWFWRALYAVRVDQREIEKEMV